MVLNIRSRAKLYSFSFSHTDAYFPKSGGNITGPTIGVNNGAALLSGGTNENFTLLQLQAVKDSNNLAMLQIERSIDDTINPVVGLYQRKNGGAYDAVGYMLHTGNKNLITPADIGAPTVAEFNSLKTSVSEGKSLIAAAVTGKGVQTAADATFQTMASNISSIKTGYTKVSDAKSSVSVGGSGSFSIRTPTFENGVIQIRCSGRTPTSTPISGTITITLA